VALKKKEEKIYDKNTKFFGSEDWKLYFDLMGNLPK